MRHNRRTILRRAGLAGAALLGGAGTVGTTGVVAEFDGGRLRGTITHFGEPVEDAEISVEGDSETTDEDGAYELEAEPGRTDLVVDADGYAEWTRRVDLAAGETETVDASLYRTWGDDTGELQVYATPVGGGETIPCHIRVYGDEEYYATTREGAVPDNYDWERGFRVSEGWWEVRVTDAAGYSDGYAEVYVDAGETELAWAELKDGSERISSVGTVRGTVMDERGNAVDGATVRLGDESVPVDENGAFETTLEHGRHPVRADADGYETRYGTVVVKFGRTSDLTVTLESA
ncbi:carboxypeptidase-like regulatory domain-containing protein [Natrialbaceae archaeon A-arb3/5]